MRLYRTKPLTEARQWDGSEEGANDIRLWVQAHGGWASVWDSPTSPGPILKIHNRSWMHVRQGDWVLRSVVSGDFTPTDDFTFKQLYEATDEGSEAAA